jgi:general secretion pathway protein D
MPSRPTYLSALTGEQARPRVRMLCTMFASIFIGLALAGCAAQMAYREGKDLVAQGKVDEGLVKLQEAVNHDPRGVEYRSAYLQTRDRAIADYLNQAERLAGENKPSDAEKFYRRALAINPNNDRALAGLNVLEADLRHSRLLSDAEAALKKKDTDNAELKLRNILTENPKHAGALALKRTLIEKTAVPPAESTLSIAYKKPITIEFKDVALRQVFEVVSRTSGLNFLFDKDVKTDQKTSIFLKNSTIASAVHFVLLTNQLEQQVLDGNTILIYPNTPAKVKDYQEMVIKTFFLSNADAKTIANSLKTIVKSRDVVIDEKLNMLIVRDSPDAIRLAEKLVALQDVAEPEVMLEVEILEVKRTRLQELGIKWPDSLTLTPLPSTTGGTLTLRDLRTNLNSGTIGAAVPPAVINAKQQDSDANILANPRIRARNHEKAKILIGERVPNITTTSTSTGFVSESVNYIDVGLKLDVEPIVYLNNDVTIKISLEVSNIVNQLQTKSGSLAYQIGTRTASTVLSLKDGENQVLAGLINDEDRRAASKLPGLGEIPLIGRLFGSTADNTQKTEIVLSITPRLIRNIQRPEAALSEFRAGTDSSLRNRPESGGASVTAPPGATQPQGVLPPSRTSPNNPAYTPPAPSTGIGAGTGIGVQGGIDPGVANNPSLNTAQLRWQGPTQVKAGSTFALQLMMQSDQPVTSLPIAVGFDSQVLQVTGVTEGEFLKQGGAQTSFSSRVDPSGQILVTGSRSGEGGATVAGIVANINFRALVPTDAARIQLLTVTPIGLAGRSVSVPISAPHTVQVQP